MKIVDFSTQTTPFKEIIAQKNFFVNIVYHIYHNIIVVVVGGVEKLKVH